MRKAEVGLEGVKRPLIMLSRSLNNYVSVKLKNELEYRGKLAQCDGYMNIILTDATEFNNGAPVAEYGQIFIRGNNIIYVCVDATVI